MGLHDDALTVVQHHFVGREEHTARFLALLTGSEGRIWWIFGPGGIGKSRLLSFMADQARSSGRPVVAADFRTGGGPTEDLIGAVQSSGSSQVGAGSPVLLLDSFEPSQASVDWLRDRLLPRMPSGSLVVIASRQAPAAELQGNAWSALLDIIPLRGLSSAEGQSLLSGAGLATEHVPKALDLAHGHPLALQLLSQQTGDWFEGLTKDRIDQAPDLVQTLLGRLVQQFPSEAHRLAVEAAIIGRVTTRGLLRGLCGQDQGDEVFDWLASQPWMDHVPDGICPHDLARDVVEADLSSNDPDRYAQAREVVCNHILERERVLRDPVRAATDYLFLHRWASEVRTAWDWSCFGQTTTTGLEPGDRDQIIELAVASYGHASGPVVEHWLDHQPSAFSVLRTSDQIAGFVTTLVFGDPTDEDLAADPSLATIWRRTLARGRLRPGQNLGFFRFVCDRKAGSLPPSPTYNLVTIQASSYWLTDTGLGLDYVVKPRDGTYRPMMDYVDFHRVPEADHRVGDREMVVYEHDWRDNPLSKWLERMESLSAGAPVRPAIDTAPVLVALDEDEFGEAVRDALRGLARPDRLIDNPLIESRVVRERLGEQGTEALVATVREAFAALDLDPRTTRARNALQETYLRGAITQEAAAEVLGTAFSTYRRHLSVGVELLTAQLWNWELHGRSAGFPTPSSPANA